MKYVQVDKNLPTILHNFMVYFNLQLESNRLAFNNLIISFAYAKNHMFGWNLLLLQQES